MNELPTYPLLKKPEDPVARSIAKPNAFASPGTLAKTNEKGTRVRPLAVKKSPGRQRIRKRDPRFVRYY
jgi:hypothetical protein